MQLPELRQLGQLLVILFPLLYEAGVIITHGEIL